MYLYSVHPLISVLHSSEPQFNKQGGTGSGLAWTHHYYHFSVKIFDCYLSKTEHNHHIIVSVECRCMHKLWSWQNLPFGNPFNFLLHEQYFHADANEMDHDKICERNIIPE